MTVPRASAVAWGLGIFCCAASGQERSVGQDAPAAVFATEPVELQLIATLVSNGRPLANIDGEVFTTGDIYEGYRVLTIGEGRVVLIKDGERTTLDLQDTREADETGD